MRVLLDTQCWLWCLLSPDRLNPAAREVITAFRDPIFLSAASSWEIAIKVAIGKLTLPDKPARYVPSALAEQGMNALPVEHSHALRVADLPPLHADPFDRMLVAQASSESLTLVTADPQLSAYGVPILRA